MKTSVCFWLASALALSASGAFFGCAKDPLSLGEDGIAEGGEPGHGGASISGGSGGMSSSGANGSGGSSAGNAGSSAVVCPESECGPQLGLPSELCEDGSSAGPTGRCLRGSDGTCGWEVLECPIGNGEAGAPNSGGASSTGGSPSGAGSPNQGGAGGAGPDACGGGCVSEELCILRGGGPGPARFVCAAWTLCGQDPCACVVGEGECNMAADGYCHCDRGLE